MDDQKIIIQDENSKNKNPVENLKEKESEIYVSEQLKAKYESGNFELTQPNKKVIQSLHFGHLGKIAFNLSIVSLAISLATILTFLLTALIAMVGVLVVLFAVIIIIFTLGLILTVPNYWDGAMSILNFTSSSAEKIALFGEKLASTWPIIVPLGILMSILSIVFLSLDKTRKHKARIIFSSIILAITVIVLILLIIGIGGM